MDRFLLPLEHLWFFLANHPKNTCWSSEPYPPVLCAQLAPVQLNELLELSYILWIVQKFDAELIDGLNLPILFDT